MICAKFYICYISIIKQPENFAKFNYAIQTFLFILKQHCRQLINTAGDYLGEDVYNFHD